jgi:hypothetical protein
MIREVLEILNNDSLSKLDKLKIIEEKRYWGYAEYIQHEFKQWEKEALKLEKKEAQRILKEGSDDSYEICAEQFYQSKMTDSIFDPSTFKHERYQRVSYYKELKDLFEDNSEEEIITVITTRHPRVELKKTYQEIVDSVFEYACKNEIIGFINDW